MMKGTIRGAFALTTFAALASTSVAGALTGTLYAVDSGRALYQVDMGTGVKTLIGTVSANAGTCAGLAYNGTTDTVYLTSSNNDSLYTLDLATGSATLVGPYGDSALVMHGLEWNSANNTMYGSSSHDGGLYTINLNTGAASLVGVSGIAGLSNFQNLVFASNTNTMYGTNSITDSFYSVDLNTGAFNLIGAIGGATNPNSMAFNSENGIIFMADNNTDTLYRINPMTGVGTVVGAMGAGNNLGLVYIPPTVTISGNLNLFDTVAGPGYSRSIAVQVQIGTKTYSSVASVAGTGNYSVTIPASATGVARLSADGSSFLKTVVAVTLTGNNIVRTLNLRNGDVDNSGEVDAADIDDVISTFANVGEPITEVDMSGEVDAADIDIVIANFGQSDN